MCWLEYTTRLTTFAVQRFLLVVCPMALARQEILACSYCGACRSAVVVVSTVVVRWWSLRSFHPPAEKPLDAFVGFPFSKSLIVEPCRRLMRQFEQRDWIIFSFHVGDPCHVSWFRV